LFTLFSWPLAGSQADSYIGQPVVCLMTCA